MRTFKVEMTLNLTDDATPKDWVFKAIEELLEDGESLTGRFMEVGYTTPKFEPAIEE